MELIDKNKAIAEIRDHAQRVGSDNDIYQLANNHVIRIISELPTVDAEETMILGYRIKDLAIIAARLRKDNIDPIVLKADNEAFLDGYKAARDEFDKSIEQSINKIIGDHQDKDLEDNFYIKRFNKIL